MIQLKKMMVIQLKMIWEQNSVVIVNLTRLWENSTSICHRYWPEEGTDLYHIYEVIAEFIECIYYPFINYSIQIGSCCFINIYNNINGFLLLDRRAQ